MRLIAISVLAVGLGACSTPVPDSGSEATGVGFGDYGTYQQQQAAREAALAGGEPLSALNVTAGLPSSAAAEPTEAESLAAQTRAALGSGVGTPPQASGSPRLSDEQNFDAVANRETIESDRVRIEQRRSQFEQVAPTALPDRPSSTGPNIVAFALSTTHAPGESVYNRSSLFGPGNARNCNRYSSANEAQTAFLAAGGPQRDRQGLDPDGDGYACGWDPTPFRLANRATN